MKKSFSSVMILIFVFILVCVLSFAIHFLTGLAVNAKSCLKIIFYIIYASKRTRSRRNKL